MLEKLLGMLEQGQDNAMLRFTLGNQYLDRNAPETAVGHLAAAVRHDPDYSAAWKLYGKALVAAGREEEAMDAYRRGVEVAERRGDMQAVKEMKVFLKRLEKQTGRRGVDR